MGLLYSSTGFVLQQCAYNNCVLHFSRIIEHKDLTIDDLIYTGEDKENDNPLMIAAKLRNKEIITTVFRSAKFKHSDNSKLCGELIHARNKDNQTLLAMVALQGIIFILFHQVERRLVSKSFSPSLQKLIREKVLFAGASFEGLSILELDYRFSNFSL